MYIHCSDDTQFSEAPCFLLNSQNQPYGLLWVPTYLKWETSLGGSFTWHSSSHMGAKTSRDGGRLDRCFSSFATFSINLRLSSLGNDYNVRLETKNSKSFARLT